MNDSGKNILGLWDGHDSGAALMRDGRLVCAVNEERLTRRKLENAFPRQSILACLRQGQIEPDQVQRVVGCTTDPAKTIARLWPASKERYYRLRRRLDAPSPLDPLIQQVKYHLTEWPGHPATRWLSTLALKRELQPLGLAHRPLTLFDHHRCHAAAAAHGLGLDETLVVTLDGVGDGRSGSLHRFHQGQLTPIASIAARNSAGIFFEQVTTLLHLRELEDEGKVMALADYAPPILPQDNPLRDWIQVSGVDFQARHHASGQLRHLRRLFWHQACEPFAAMAQQALEHWVVTLVTNALQATGAKRLALAGGVFANVRLNGRIRALPGVEVCHVFPHMGDGGLAVGAVCLAGSPRTDWLTDLHLGPEHTPETIARVVRNSGLPHRHLTDPVTEAARLLTAGRIVGWFQGRMEYGPRALGGRSVLARPDLPGIRDTLNLRLKKRAWYQPFCPAMRDSEAARLLADHHGPPNRCMTSLYHVRSEFQSALAGVIGPNGTCRPQMVADDAPGPFAALLAAMQESTGFGVLLNTSFNPHGAPLVNTPREALSAFQTMGLDHLVMGEWIVDGAVIRS
ncbi:MAG: hypothetical protein HQL99_01455 [Magnetococcales bacterium]|nr:hypothetical protein [Magnetococcales bacterium]